MKTKKLIDTLCDELEPVKPLAHPIVRARPWVLLAAVYMVAAIFIRGIRADLMTEKIHDTAFIFEVALAVLIMASALLTSFWTSIPDMRGQKWLVSLPITFTLVFVIWTISRSVGEHAHFHEFFWHNCFQDGILFATLPIAGLLTLSANRYATCSITCTTLNILSASAMGFIALRFTCMDDSIEHAILYHLAPFVVLGIIIGLISRRLYRW